MNTSFKYIIVFAFIGFLGCSQPIERSELIGKYIANHSHGVDVLELKDDGTYTYYYKSTDGKTFLTNTNKWLFEYQNKEPRITFEKFVFGLPGYGTKAPGFWDVETEKSGKRLRLCIDPDLNYYYEKQKL